MRHALAIAAREFEEKRFVAYAALAFAILPFVIGVIPGINGKSPNDTIAVSSLIFATGFAVALAVMTGASFVGRDLSDNRMSFYFSRPVASASIWFGKLTAGLLMVVGCFAVIIAPAWLATGSSWKRFSTVDLEKGSILILIIALALFLAAHVIGTFARSRSPWIAADFAAAVVCGVAIRFLVIPLAAGDASVLISELSVWLSIAVVVAIVGGGVWQLERGRTDRRRNHLALSQFLWSTMAVALLIAAGYVAWVVSVKPGDLSIDLRSTGSTSGPFAVITGKAPGRGDYHAGFLLNTDDGSLVRIPSLAVWSVLYTRNGRSAVVPRIEGNVTNVWIYRRGLKEPIDTGLTVEPRGLEDFFVSDDGGRIATISWSNILSVYDVAQKRSLASVRLPEARYVFVHALFESPDVVRLYLHTEKAMKIAELDVRARGLRETGSIATSASIYPDASAAHMLVMPERGADVVTLNDARTGALITTLASRTQVKTARFLRDGRIAIVDGPDSATVLHILSAAGVPQRDIPLGPARSSIFVGDDGTRCVLTVETAARVLQLIAVDLNRGVIERRVAIVGLVPSGTFDLRPPIEPLRDVFYGDYSDHKNHIVSWNPSTGAKRRII
jgi:ABC-type transport system involved in multi-copper enzyme maturation permease subunit